jgi:hypothetical protein
LIIASLFISEAKVVVLPKINCKKRSEKKDIEIPAITSVIHEDETDFDSENPVLDTSNRFRSLKNSSDDDKEFELKLIFNYLMRQMF